MGKVFDNDAVRKAIEEDKKIVMVSGKFVWPDSTVGQSNFQMAIANKDKTLKGTNYGHSESFLLTNNGLENMLTLYKDKYKECPQYVLFYTRMLPCIRTKDKTVINCAYMIINARKNLQSVDFCPGMPFYLYSNDLPAPGEQASLPNEEKIKIIFASGNNIIPLHPPPNAFATNYGAHATVNRIQAPRLSKRKKCRRG